MSFSHSFLRNSWYVAGWSHHFNAGELVARTIVGERIVLYRTSSGAVTALEDRCCHRMAPLSRGRLEGDDLRCMYHGIKFSADGRCLEIPAQDQIPPGLKVRTYPVVEKDRWIWVWMGEAARADISLIPTALNHDHPDYAMRTGEMGYEANYQLVHDNLLDLTHLGFVHENTLGATGDRLWGTVRPVVQPIERGVRVSRWFRGRKSPRYLGRPQEPSDTWNSFDFVVPGVFLLRSCGYPVGSANAFPDGPEASSTPAWIVLTSQAVTPCTERKTFYYYSACQLASHANDQAMAMQLQLFDTAFAEDKSMIEAQQGVIDQSPGRSLTTLQFDRSIAHFRRLMAKLIREDQPTAVSTEAAE
jgi:vanillate O-demethylase monooxygenase subunit